MKLVDAVDKVIVLYHEEKPDELIAFLEGEGFAVLPLRNPWKEEYSGYSLSYLAFMAHMMAWKEALKYSRTLICEYDFVPVRGFGTSPVPFDPEEKDMGICWLYATGPRFYGIRHQNPPGRYIQGGATSLVSYVISQNAASVLFEYGLLHKKSGTPKYYSHWDSSIDGTLLERGLINFVPLRNLGEHGGISNPEHVDNLVYAWDHKADVLSGHLAFSPLYAKGMGAIRYCFTRLKGYVRGVARLFGLRLLSFKVIRESNYRFELLYLAICRFFGTIW